jgi:hypothetical protein
VLRFPLLSRRGRGARFGRGDARLVPVIGRGAGQHPSVAPREVPRTGCAGKAGGLRARSPHPKPLRSPPAGAPGKGTRREEVRSSGLPALRHLGGGIAPPVLEDRLVTKRSEPASQQPRMTLGRPLGLGLRSVAFVRAVPLPVSWTPDLPLPPEQGPAGRRTPVSSGVERCPGASGRSLSRAGRLGELRITPVGDGGRAGPRLI